MNVTLTINHDAEIPGPSMSHPSIHPADLVTVNVNGRPMATLLKDEWVMARRHFRNVFAMARDPRDDISDTVVMVLIADEAAWSPTTEKLFPRLTALARGFHPAELIERARYIAGPVLVG